MRKGSLWHMQTAGLDQSACRNSLIRSGLSLFSIKGPKISNTLSILFGLNFAFYTVVSYPLSR